MENLKINFFSLIYYWIKNKILNLFNNETINFDEIKDVLESIEIYFHTNINGYNIKNAELFCGDYCCEIGEIPNTMLNSSKITLTSDNVNFKTLTNFVICLDLISDTNETIHLSEVILGLNELVVNGDKIYYKLTADNLGLKPITFNPSVEDYKKPIMPIFKF